MKSLVGKETATVKGRNRYFQQGHIQEEGGGHLGAFKCLPVFWCKQLTHWQRPWCWRRLRAEGEGDDRGWDGWVASPMQWTWTWANSGRWWGTEKPAMLQQWGRQESDTTGWLDTSAFPTEKLPTGLCQKEIGGNLRESSELFWLYAWTSEGETSS